MEPQSPTEPAKLFLQTHALPKRFRIDGLDPNTVEWAEYGFGSKLIRGYRVTIAAVIVPSIDIVALGASACAPDDAEKFDRADAANRAMGRARQLATWILTKGAGSADWRRRDTLFGAASMAVHLWSGFLTPTPLASLRDTVTKFQYDQVARHVEQVACDAALKALRRRFPSAHMPSRIG